MSFSNSISFRESFNGIAGYLISGRFDKFIIYNYLGVRAKPKLYMFIYYDANSAQFQYVEGQQVESLSTFCYIIIKYINLKISYFKCSRFFILPLIVIISP